MDAPRELPPVVSLSDAQQRGVRCVFCGVPLSAETAVDLGPRAIGVFESTVHWFPRSCRKDMPM
ncbi:hypothetical protein [Streptomyces gelaticus]|uniref:hypothetical protein n=1 Tax=Streptomyces gelaticus TaxID=285446 RepID=UPI001E610A64|nr:hypothetical protein [Streptomyces gelaticus]